jgi:elongation factor Ts
MTKVTAADVNKLRQQTGAGMMDCKNALVEAEGNIEKAIENLRKRGQKLASKRADRDANEGYVLAKTNSNKDFGIILMLNCETDFVAKNDDFVNFSNQLAEIALSNKAKNIDELKQKQIDNISIEDKLTEMIGKIGEKIDLARYEVVDANYVYAYNHPGNRISSIAGFNKNDVNEIESIGKEITMQIAAMKPIALSEKEIPQAIIDKEIEIGKELAIKEGKNPELAEKIATGKLNKFFKENTLMKQEYIGESKKTVSEFIAEQDKDLNVLEFKRFALGE